MAIEINYTSYVISITKADTTFVEINTQTGLEIRQYSVETFGKALADLQDDPEGIWAETAFEYTAPKDVGGIQLAPVLLILNPYTITFEDLPYAVNLIGGNTNLQDFVNVNQVSIRPSNSVGNTFSDAVNSQSFLDSAVVINKNGKGVAGIGFPIGTPPQPSDNYPDAFTIADKWNFSDYHLDGTLVLTMSDDVVDTNWTGNSPIKSAIVFTGQDTSKCTFYRLGITGTMVSTDRCAYEACAIGGPLNLVGFSGIAEGCGFNGNITLDPTVAGTIYFGNCSSVIAGINKPIVDCNGTTEDIQFRGYIGGLKITNFTGGGNMSIDMSGRLELDASCTSGTIIVGGTVLLTDNSGVDCTVISSSTVTELAIAGSGLTVAQDIKLDELHKLQGLDVGNPLVVTPDSMDVAGIEIVITGDGETNSTLTRQ